MLDNISNRERIEWGNTWWEEANNPKVDRIAMLGDSVIRGLEESLTIWVSMITALWNA
jgi:hypothetical protein